jgi:hypothetical protein
MGKRGAGNISPEERQRLAVFREDKYWKEWKATLHKNNHYESQLFGLLAPTRLNLSPTQLVEQAKSPETVNDLSKRVKIAFAQMKSEYDPATLRIFLSALRNFLALNELVLPLIGFKIEIPRKVKPFMSWNDAEKVISLSNLEYQNVFRVMLWGIDRERFIQLNKDKKRLDAIKTQLKDESRDWIKIMIPAGRKRSAAFYLLIPRSAAELLPVLDQHGHPIVGGNNITRAWRNGLRRAGFDYEQYGPHNLRSVWMSEATRRKLDPILREFQLGHTVDDRNYQRLTQDEKWVTEQFRQAWETQPLVTEDQLASRDARMQTLESENKDLKARLERLEAISVERLVLAAATKKQATPHKQKQST